MGLLVVLVLVVALLVGVPVAMSLGLCALAGLLYSSPEFLIVLPQKYLAGIDSFPLLAIPLFVLAGSLISHGGMARRIVDMAMLLVGRLPGGLGLVVVLAVMMFSGISGSPAANTAAIGSIALPSMRERGIRRPLQRRCSPRPVEFPSWCPLPSISSSSAWLRAYRSVRCSPPGSCRRSCSGCPSCS